MNNDLLSGLCFGSGLNSVFGNYGGSGCGACALRWLAATSSTQQGEYDVSPRTKTCMEEEERNNKTEFVWGSGATR